MTDERERLLQLIKQQNELQLKMVELLCETMERLGAPRVADTTALIRQGREGIVTPAEAIAAMIAARNDALEEAARLSDLCAKEATEEPRRWEAAFIAAAIRALKSEEKPNG